MASLLKLYLRELPEPLLTEEHSGEFLRAMHEPTPEERLTVMKAAFLKLPAANFRTIRALLRHLNKVIEHEDHNRMSPANLAMCFGPTLLGAYSDAGLPPAPSAPGASKDILLSPKAAR